MNRRHYRVLVAILLLATNLITASVVYGLLYSVPAVAQRPALKVAVVEPIPPKPDLKIPDSRNFPFEPIKRDPFQVLDDFDFYDDPIDAITSLKAKWILRGIAIVGRRIVTTPRQNPDGSDSGELKSEEVDVAACFFAENPRYYRVGDRLEGTKFTVQEIHFGTDGTYVELQHHLGARTKLPLETK